MYNPNRDNGPFGGGSFGGGRRNASAYQYQTLPYGYQGAQQASGLMSKVMGLLAFSFIFATIGAFVGARVITSGGPYLLVVIAGFVVLIALQFLIQKQGVNLFLLYLFTFLEGMGLGPLLGSLLADPVYANIVTEAFLITALTSLGLGVYAWTAKRDFTRLGDYLFFGVILLIVASLLNFIFQMPLLTLIICIIGIAIFSAYVLYYVQRAKYMVDTLPNAIGLTVSLFLTLINLFLYILELLMILQGGGRRR